MRKNIWDLAVEKYLNDPFYRKQMQEAAKVVREIDFERIKPTLDAMRKEGFFNQGVYIEPREKTKPDLPDTTPTKNQLMCNEQQELTPEQYEDLINNLSPLGIKKLAIFKEYEKFIKEYKYLKGKYFIEKENQLVWLKSKVSLAQYFGFQKEGESIGWKCVEKLFGKKGLKGDFNSNGRTPSKDYTELLAYLEKCKEKIKSSVVNMNIDEHDPKST